MDSLKIILAAAAVVGVAGCTTADNVAERCEGQFGCDGASRAYQATKDFFAEPVKKDISILALEHEMVKRCHMKPENESGETTVDGFTDPYTKEGIENGVLGICHDGSEAPKGEFSPITKGTAESQIYGEAALKAMEP